MKELPISNGFKDVPIYQVQQAVSVYGADEEITAQTLNESLTVSPARIAEILHDMRCIKLGNNKRGPSRIYVRTGDPRSNGLEATCTGCPRNQDNNSYSFGCLIADAVRNQQGR